MRRAPFLLLCLLPLLLRGQSVKPAAVMASSEQAKYPASHAADGAVQTFWVSYGSEPGQGPTAGKPESLDFMFTPAATINAVDVLPRPLYGPARMEVLSSGDGKNFELLATADGKPEGALHAAFKPTTATYFRLRFTAAHDPLQKQRPRNVQVAEVLWKRAQSAAAGGAP